MLMQPKGRTTIRPQKLGGDEQPRRVRLWTISPKAGSTAEQLMQRYLGALDAVDRIGSKKAELAGNADLTEIGRQKSLVNFALGQGVPEFAKGRLALAKARSEAAARREKLKPAAPDPGDLAAALRRQELRAIMRGMDDKQRNDFLTKNGRVHGLNPEIRQAILEQPASLSGVSDAFRDEQLRQAVEATHGPELEDLAQLETAIEIAASAISEGRAEFQREAALADPRLRNPENFNALAAEVEKRIDIPWLKKSTEDGVEVIRAVEWDDASETKGSWRVATPAQIESGLFAKTRDEFAKLKAEAQVVSIAFGSDADARAKRVEYVTEHGVEAYINRNNA
jgi:hypothetical protein